MIDKDYLQRLKEEDYIAWAEIVHDPMICGDGDDYSGCFILAAIGVVAIVAALFFWYCS